MSAQASRPPRIGLTGPIGCGKSTVGSWLAARGAIVIDADGLAREVTAPGRPALAAIEARFGRDVFATDGSLDRGALGRIVFADPAALADLERIVHPGVRARLVASIERAQAAKPLAIVVEAIKLVEGGYAAECDEVWFVWCDPAAQVVRLIGRGMSEADAAARIAAQGDIRSRVAGAVTRWIETSGDARAAEDRVAAAFADVLPRPG